MPTPEPLVDVTEEEAAAAFAAIMSGPPCPEVERLYAGLNAVQAASVYLRCLHGPTEVRRG